MLGEFAREEETHCRLDLSARDGVALVVACKTPGLGRKTLEDVVHERVHDAHGLLGDAGVGVHLAQHLVDEAGVARVARLLLLLVCGGLLLCLCLCGLLGDGFLFCGFGHFCFFFLFFLLFDKIKFVFVCLFKKIKNK